MLWSSISFAQKEFKTHSHNDYLQRVPFWEAFAAHSSSIEADVILQRDTLFVAHEQSSIQKRKTLESIYLDPIRQGVKNGVIQEINFVLLIDFKTEAYVTIGTLLKSLKNYEEILFSSANPKGLKLVISGSRPNVEDYDSYPAYIQFDYQSTSLNEDLPWHKIGMVSLSFRQFSNWNGDGEITEREKVNLEEFIGTVHSFGKEVRFWATPDSERSWKFFNEIGVDYINTDQPAKAFEYLDQLSGN